MRVVCDKGVHSEISLFHSFSISKSKLYNLDDLEKNCVFSVVMVKIAVSYILHWHKVLPICAINYLDFFIDPTKK